MMDKTYRIADHNLRIQSLFEPVHSIFREYEVSGEPEFCIAVTQSDIDAEREKAAISNNQEGRTTKKRSDEYLETLAVYRKIAEKMLDYDTILFHGSVIAVDGKGYLFTAKSGTGKSTHTRLWRQLLGEKDIMINDDKPLIHISDSGAVIYGTPWNGKHALGNNCSAQLEAICKLERAEQNHIQKISGSEALPFLLQQSYKPCSTENMIKTLSLLDKLIKNVRFYRLQCNKDLEAARVSWEAMRSP